MEYSRSYHKFGSGARVSKISRSNGVKYGSMSIDDFSIGARGIYQEHKESIKGMRNLPREQGIFEGHKDTIEDEQFCPLRVFIYATGHEGHSRRARGEEYDDRAPNSGGQFKLRQSLQSNESHKLDHTTYLSFFDKARQ